MILLIAEKKLAAYAYARALSQNYKEQDGYLVGDNQLFYTWAQGHLLQFVEPDEIREEWEVWNWEQLPIIPKEIPLKPIKGQEKQLYLIKKLATSSKMIINGMDCEIEGEAIFRNIISYLKLEHLPSKRLWTASLQVNAIREAFRSLKEPHELESLAVSGATRAKLDYIVGINTSRCLSLVGNGQTLPMGRLIGSSLALVNNREQARANFTEENYYTMKAEFKVGKAIIGANYSGERIIEKEKVNEMIAFMQQHHGTIDYTEQTKEQLPPILLNHTDVLVIIHQRYGLRPKETSAHLETLYLKGLISYPRTNARYVTKDEIVPLRATLRILSEVYPNLAKGADIELLHAKNDRLVNIVSDHHAIIPTPAIPKDLTEEEKWVYQLIVERFFLQTQKPKKSKVRSVMIKFNDEIVFKTSYQITLELGWKGIFLNFDHDEILETEKEDADSTEIDVESFSELDKFIPVEFVESTSKACTTKPPASYTEGTLMKQMENVANVVENPKYKKILKGCGIGTSATRAETIQKLQDIGYLSLDKKKLFVSPLGESVMKLLNFEQAKQIISPEMTALWEISLQEIRTGKPPEEFEKGITNFIQAFIGEMKEQGKQQVKVFASEHKCPECESHLKTTAKTYKCTSCDFFIWRSQYFKTLTPKMIDDLLKNGETAVLTFTAKDKKSKYKAKLALPVENGKVTMTFI
ncbi:MAG: hypothetical protein KBT36_03390 [Kurthia sp.]|nr:hypothetical protein [Candidatus Kurthia equi]